MTTTRVRTEANTLPAAEIPFICRSIMYASMADDEKLWPNMAAESVVLQLDVLFVVLALLTLRHAIAQRGVWKGSALVLFLALHTAIFEHMSLFLGGTHCHATSPILPKLSPCSSVNSVLFYVPWIYTSIEAATKLNLHPFAFPFVVGLLQFGFGVVYEMQGPINNFWKWPDEDGVIAESPLLLAPWDGYPPITLLKDAQDRNEVGTIAAGVFRVSRHAQEALEERLFGFPILAPYFHFAYGFAWAMGLVLTGTTTANNSTPVTTTPYALSRIVVSGLQSTVLFILPIEITRKMTGVFHLPYSLGVPISLGLSFVPIYLFRSKNKKATAISSTDAKSSSSSSQLPVAAGKDWLLFSISLVMHAFMVSFPWRAPTPTPSGLVILVTMIATIHLATQFYCCIGM